MVGRLNKRWRVLCNSQGLWRELLRQDFFTELPPYRYLFQREEPLPFSNSITAHARQGWDIGIGGAASTALSDPNWDILVDDAADGHGGKQQDQVWQAPPLPATTRTASVGHSPEMTTTVLQTTSTSTTVLTAALTTAAAATPGAAAVTTTTAPVLSARTTFFYFF